MATSLISPGVEVREIDLTTIVPSVSTTEGALAGVFRWGPLGQRILIDSEVDLVQRFGKPTGINYETFFTASAFLSYGNRLYISRAGNTSGVTPTVTANIESGNTTLTLSTGNTDLLEVGMFSINSANGGLANGAAIASIVNSTAFTITTSSDALSTATEDEIQFLSNTLFSAVANTAAVANLEYSTIKNADDFIAKDGNIDTDVKFIARYPGVLGSSLRVSVCGNSTGYESTINLAAYGTYADLVVNTSSNTANLSVAAAANADGSANAVVLRGLINNTDLITVGNTTIGTQLLKVVSLTNTATYGTAANDYAVTTTAGNNLVTANNTTDLAAGMVITAPASLQGLVVNNVVNSTAIYTISAPTVSLAANDATITPRATFQINFEDNFSLATNYSYVSSNTITRTFKRNWEFFNFVDTTPGQSTYQTNFGNSSVNNDEIHVVITDEGGKFTGVPGSVLETYESLSLGTDSKTVDGVANHYKTVINERSRYIWAANDLSGATSNTSENLGNSTLDVSVLDLKYGNDGQDESNLPITDLTAAYDLFANKEDFDVSLIMQGKARSFTLANYIIDNILHKRKDCVGFISPQRGDVVSNPNNETDAAIAFRNNVRSTSYALMDSGYKYVYDRYNDVYRYVPLNGDTAGLCVRTDRVAEAWFPPAGYNRGQIKNIVRLAWNPRQAHRDSLYKAGINPVVSFPGQGTILFGDKTLLAKPSAFDRINVRRLFIVLEKAIEEASKYSLFELNDEFTRLQFRNLVVPYLRDVQGRRGITAFRVVCDNTNNTSTVIDRNEFVADIYIKPARSINFIRLNFVAVPTGIEFNEIVGSF